MEWNGTEQSQLSLLMVYCNTVHIPSNLCKSGKFWGILLHISVNCHAVNRVSFMPCAAVAELMYWWYVYVVECWGGLRQLGSNNTKQTAIARKSALTCSATVHPWRPLCAVYVCRYLLCVLAYVLEMSHYTEEHMYTHTSLVTHISLYLYACTHKCLPHTQPISMHMDCNTYTYTR